MADAKPAARWTAAAETLFLAELARSSDVTAALAHAGLSEAAVLRRRRENPDFARAWDRALSDVVVIELTDMIARMRKATDMPEATRLQIIAGYEKRLAAYRADGEVRRQDTAAIRKRILDKVMRLAKSMGLEMPA